MDVRAVLKVYIFTNKHNQIDFKIGREMVKRIGLVLVFFCPTHTICLSLCVREEKFAKHLTMVESRLQDMSIHGQEFLVTLVRMLIIVSSSDLTKTAADMLRYAKEIYNSISHSTDIFWILSLKMNVEKGELSLFNPTMYFSALRTKPPNSGSLSFLSLGASKDEGLALVLAAVNGATG